MTKRERAALGKYVRSMADLMELRDWTVSIGGGFCADDLEAESSCVYGQKHVTITFCEGFRDRSPGDQRDTVVHELIHAHFNVCWTMVQGDLADALGKPVYYVFCDSFRRAMEYAVDGLAKSVGKHVPLIEWPK